MRSLFTRFSISTVIVLAAAVWGGSLWVLSIPVDASYLKPFSLTVVVVTVILSVFEKWVWRCWPVYYFVSVPDLRGEWDVEILSTYKGETSIPTAIHGTATIKQTFSTLSIRISTKSSDSALKAERIVASADGAVEIYGVYQSEPDIHLRGSESEIHYGAFRYVVKDSPATLMTGTYWTDRITKGSIKLKRK